MALQGLPTYFQFVFGPRQREILAAYRDRIHQRLADLQSNESGDTNDGDTSIQPAYSQLIQEANRFSRYLEHYADRPVGLAASLLPWFIRELQRDINHVPEWQNQSVKEAAYGTLTELLQLHYMLSQGLLHHVSEEIMQCYWEQYWDQESLERWRRNTPRTYLDTAGMDEVEVFTALYNRAKPQGQGHLHYQEGDISSLRGAELYEQLPNSLDYVVGRGMKIRKSDIKKGRIDVTTYNKYNGEGAAQEAVANLQRV